MRKARHPISNPNSTWPVHGAGRWLRRVLVVLWVCSGWAHATAPMQVMLLVSYNSGMAWSDDQIAGVRSQLQPLGDQITLNLNFLDTKNVVPSAAYYQKMEELLLFKYGRTPPALLLATDDDALDFALQMRQHHYPGVPILFSGVSASRKDALLQAGNVSGVFDDIDVSRNLGALLALRPHLGKLVVVHDQSRTSLAQLQGLRTAAAQHPGLVVEYLTHMDVATIQSRLRTLSPNDLVLALAFNRDDQNRVLSHEDATDLWVQASAAPVLVTRDVNMRAGVLGGYLITGRQQGETLGHLAVQVLHGTAIATLPMQGGHVQPIFNYAQLQHWGIGTNLLTPDAQVLHQPPGALAALRPHLPWLATLFGSLLVIIALLLHGIRIRRQSEATLRQSEQNYRQLFNTSTDAILVRDVDTGAIVDTNPRFSALYGYTAEEALHLNAADLSANVAPYTPEAVAHYMAQTRAGTPQLFEWCSQRKDGSIFWSQVSMTQFDLPNGQRIVSTVRDITELKTAQRNLQELNQQLEARVVARTNELQRVLEQLVQSEKLAALGSMVVGMAHALNTPIGNTLLATSTMKDLLQVFDQTLASGAPRRSEVQGAVQRLQEGIALVERSTLRAAKLVTDFKQVAVDQGSGAQRSFSLHEVVHSVVVAASPLFAAGQHHITVDVDHGIAMDSYPGPLEQVLTHFLNNALAHAFAGRKGGEVAIHAHRDNDTVVLTVTDDGCGIAQSLQNHVFEPFYTTRLGHGGSGLGLYVVHSLVCDVLCGGISLVSTPGQGSTFTVRLPCVAPDVTGPAPLL